MFDIHKLHCCGYADNGFPWNSCGFPWNIGEREKLFGWKKVPVISGRTSPIYRGMWKV